MITSIDAEKGLIKFNVFHNFSKIKNVTKNICEKQNKKLEKHHT